MTLRQPLFSVASRSRASAILLLAALVMATAATTLVATVPMYADAISEAGFRSTLADATATDRGAEAVLRAEAADFDEVTSAIDNLARQRIHDELRTVALGETDTFRFPTGRYGEREITSIGTLNTSESIDPLFDVIDGSPSATSSNGALPVSLSADAAQRLDLAIGGQLELTSRAGDPLTVELVAVLQVIDRFDDLWLDKPEFRDGVTVVGTFTEVGPFLVSPAQFVELDQPARISWRGVIDPISITTADIDQVRAGAFGLSLAIRDNLDRDDIDVATAIPSLLARTDVALSSTGAVIAVILLQLVGLALYGLGLAAAVLAGSRLTETSLLRARGATARQMGVLAATEALMVAIPAAVLGPVLARLVVGLIGRSGPVAASGLELDAMVTAAPIIASVIVAILAVGVITWPAVRSAKALADAQVERARPTGPNALQRSGADIVIAVLALLALWRLTGSSVATRDISGRLGVDPVLVLAPTLGVVAASLITLRLIALFSNGAQRVAATGSGLAAALAGCELARRPTRTSRTSVLVVLSVTVGTFAAVQGSSWQRSQQDQANAAVSADAVVDSDLRPAATVAPLFLPDAYRQAPGVQAVVPVDRPTVTITSDLDVTAVATDTAAVGDVLRLRDDLAVGADDLSVLQSPIDLQTIPLGDEVGDLTVGYAMEHSGTAIEGNIEVAVLLVDRFGTIHRLEAAPVPADQASAKLTFALTSEAVPEVDLRAAGPISLLQIEIVAPVVLDDRLAEQPLAQAGFTLMFNAFSLGDKQIDLEPRSWAVLPLVANNNTILAGSIAVEPSNNGVEVQLETGLSERRRARVTAVLTTASARLQGTAEPVLLPTLVTAGLLAGLELEVGDAAVARVDGTIVQLQLAGILPVTPFATERPVSMLIDWSTIVAARYVASGRHGPPTQWALAIDDPPADDRAVGDLGRVLLAEPFSSVGFEDRRNVARKLADDPFAVGLFGSLALALVASLLIAVVGLLLTAVVGARERRVSYSVLRAMGAPIEVLRRWLLLEIVPLVGLSAGAGLVAGVLLARSALESLTITSTGARAIPQPAVVIPWPTIGLIVGVALAAGIALPLLTARLLGRNQTADDLRIGDST